MGVPAQTARPDCAPFLCPPTGPSLPFGEPLLLVLDALRVVIMLGGIYMIAMSAMAITLVRQPRQRGVYAAVIIATLSIMGTELDHLGDYIHYRFLINMAFVGVGCWALHRIQRSVRDWNWADPPTGRRRRA